MIAAAGTRRCRAHQENDMRRCLFALLMMVSLGAQADSALPFMKHLAGDNELPPPWGIGIDFYTQDQDYQVKSLEFQLPGVAIPDLSVIGVTNEIQHFDVKADAWLFPFLNVFALLGQVQSDTTVDLGGVPLPGQPVSLGKLPVDTDGSVWGVGFTLAVGGPGWFSSVTTTWTDANLGGDLNSSAESLAVQPRFGFIRNSWTAWVGGMYLDTEETHSGTINIPGLGGVPFDVVLETSDQWNTTTGIMYNFSARNAISFEYGFGDRTHTLLNWNYRY
jgi:hypothetical protein